MNTRTTGRYERTAAGGEQVAAFIPYALPPTDPPICLEGTLLAALHTAEHALARLQLAGEMVPSVDGFIHAFVRKEAVLSSQIEGTRATLVDLLNFEAQNAEAEVLATPDIEEVRNCLDAIVYARHQVADQDGLPLSMRLLNEAHGQLMRGVRGTNKQPGSVRRSQNWIGGRRPGNATFVPPPPLALPELLSALERYVHAEDTLPKLVRVGLLHVQFETIHPYLDGNGRIGRLLMTLLLQHWQLLDWPLLYLSLYLKRHRAEYYRRLGAVRLQGDWEGWLEFFLEGVAVTADDAVDAVRKLAALMAADRERVLADAGSSIFSLRLFERLQRQPIVTVAAVMKLLDTTKPTAGRAVDALVDAGVLIETTGRRRDRAWAYRRYLDQLCEGTELDRE